MVYNRQLMSYMPYATGMLPTMLGPKPRSAYRSSVPRTRTVTTTRRRKRGGSTSLRSAIIATKPSKQYTVASSVALVHNTLNTMNVTAGVTQGDGNSNRDGDSISLSALKISGSYFSDSVAGAYTMRIIVGYSGEEYSTTTLGSGLGTTEVFLPATTTTFTHLGQINPKAFTVLHDEKIDLNSQIAAVVDVNSFNVHVSLNNAKFDYQSTASIYGKTKNLYVICVAGVGGGSSGVTAAGSVVLNANLIFK